MAIKRLYLDFNATAPLHPSARAAMIAALDVCGNASSIHSEGRAARSLVEAARAKVALLVGAAAKNVIFTSGGTEAAHLALSPSLRDGRGGSFDRLFIGAGEHACVLHGHRFAAADVEVLPLLPDGTLDLAALASALDGLNGRRPVLALQAANNETGVIQPVVEAARLVHAKDGLVICDAVQAAGRIACSLATLEVDAMILSAHKLGGPKGAGALVFAADHLHIGEPVLRGGGQEHGFRAGTENVAAIVGFATMADVATRENTAVAMRWASWRDHCEAELKRIAPEAVVFGAGARRLPNTSAFAVPGITAETLLIALDLEGLALSSGSACSSGKVRPSHVLAAMGVAPDVARGALRASFGWATSEDDVSGFCEALEKTLRKIKLRRLGKAA
jgi:cysteine desulfurase